MKKMHKILVLLAGLVLVTTSCEPAEAYIKQYISNLHYDGEYIVWDVITGANSYIITIDDGHNIEVNQGSTVVKYKYDSQGADFSFTVEALIGKQGSIHNPTYSIDFENVGDVSNVHVEEGNLTWDYLDNADGYEIYLNGHMIDETVRGNTYELSAGDFNARVRSYKTDPNRDKYNNNKYYSFWSNSISGKMLGSVENLSFDSDKFKWDSVNGANGYTIRIGDQEFNTNTNSYVSGTLVDDLSVSVRANGDANKNIYSSKWSQPKEYKYIPPIDTLRVENGTLVWDRPNNAVKYKIKINGVTQQDLLATEKYDKIQPGVSTTVQILPVGETEMFYSSWSNPITINILRAPSISYENNVIKWNAIPGADGYSINIVKDDKEENYTVGSETLTYHYDFGLVGLYRVAVKATVVSTGNGVYESKYSNVLNFTHLSTPNSPTVLNQPLEQNQVMITSANVANASKYYLYANDVMIKESNTPVFNVDISSINSSNEEVVVKMGIKAVGSVNDNDIYLDSEIREFNVTKLAAPKNLEINGNQLTWSSVANAEKYIVTIDGTRVEVTSNYYTLTDMAAGEHSIYVQSEGDGENVITSSHSNVLSVTKLAKPVIKTTKVGEKFYIEWQAISGATGYNVTLGSQNETAPSNSFIISDKLSYFVAGQGTQVSVYAKGNGTTIIDSDPSNTQTILRYEAPTNVQLTSDNLIWNAPSVGGIVANDFSLIVDGCEPLQLTGTTYSLANFTAGTHTVKIKANGKVDNLTIDSEYSNEFTFTKLADITGVTKNGNKISWDPVVNALGYEVKLSQDSLPRLVNTNEVEVEYSKTGTYAISIKAKGNDVNICDSNKLSIDQSVRNIATPVRNVDFALTQTGNEINIEMYKNVLATGYALYVGGALYETNKTGLFYFLMSPESLHYSFQVAYLGQQFGEDGIYYINSNKSSEIIIDYVG